MKPGVFNPKVQNSTNQPKRSGRGGFYDEEEPKQQEVKINQTLGSTKRIEDGGFRDSQLQQSSTTKPITPKFTM